MKNVIDILPLNDELPGNFADRVGVLYANTVTAQHKKINGQFLTIVSLR